MEKRSECLWACCCKAQEGERERERARESGGKAKECQAPRKSFPGTLHRERAMRSPLGARVRVETES